MALYGYARVSTLEQDLRIQRAALKAAGCDIVRAEKASGTRRDGRTELQVLIEFLRPGDALVVTRVSPRRPKRRRGQAAPVNAEELLPNRRPPVRACAVTHHRAGLSVCTQRETATLGRSGFILALSR